MKSFNFGSDKSYPWYTLFYRRGHLLILSLLVLVTAGLSALGSLPRIEDPRIDTRNALIITQYPGASAERVEALVSDVLEDRLREIFEIKEVKSTSRAGISIILIETQDWINNSTNEQLFSEIRDAIGAAAESFPEGAMAPLSHSLKVRWRQFSMKSAARPRSLYCYLCVRITLKIPLLHSPRVWPKNLQTGCETLTALSLCVYTVRHRKRLASTSTLLSLLQRVLPYSK